MRSGRPVYIEAEDEDCAEAWLERDGVHIPLQRCFDTNDDHSARALPPDAEDARVHRLAIALDPRAVLPNDMRDIPADITRRATFAVRIAHEDEIVDRWVTPGVASTIAAVAKVSAAVAKVSAAVAKVSAAVAAAAPALATMAAVSRTAAAVERFGSPALISSPRLSPAEAAQLFHDAPPRLSPAEQAIFAAAARDLPKGP